MGAGGSSHTALSSGDLDRNGARQIHRPKPLILATNSGGGEATATPTFLVPIPDARLRVKITVAFVPNAGQANPNLTGAGTIWIAACDYEQGGIGGGGGRILPVTDLEGTQAAPTAFPGSADLLGYSREFTTSSDVIQVVPTLSSVGAVPGAWLAFTRFQPFDCPFLSFAEWDEVRRLCLPQMIAQLGAL